MVGRLIKGRLIVPGPPRRLAPGRTTITSFIAKRLPSALPLPADESVRLKEERRQMAPPKHCELARKALPSSEKDHMNPALLWHSV